MGKALRISDVNECLRSDTHADGQESNDPSQGDLDRIQGFLQQTITDGKGPAQLAGNNITIRWEIDGLSATINDGAQGRFTVIPLESFGSIGLEVGQVLAGAVRVVWRASRYPRKR